MKRTTLVSISTLLFIALAIMVLVVIIISSVFKSNNSEDKDMSRPQGGPEVQLQAFEFEISFSSEQVDVEFSPGSDTENFICINQDSSNSQFEDIAKIRCVVNEEQTVSEADPPEELPIVIVEVKPKTLPEESANKADNDTSGGSALDWLIAALIGAAVAGIVGFATLRIRTRRS